LKTGDSIVVFNGTQKDYECKIVKIDPKSTMCLLDVTATIRSRFERGRKIILCAAIVKKDTFEWIVEKATELGVTDIIPVAAERSEKKSLNEERLKKIAIEASEQSGRGDVPVIHEIESLEEAIKFPKPTLSLPSEINKIAFHTEGDPFLQSDLDNTTDPIMVFIGPEGGWSPKELEMFHAQNIKVRCLGTQVLRAETAVVAALSQVVFAN